MPFPFVSALIASINSMFPDWLKNRPTWQKVFAICVLCGVGFLYFLIGPSIAPTAINNVGHDNNGNECSTGATCTYNAPPPQGDSAMIANHGGKMINNTFTGNTTDGQLIDNDQGGLFSGNQVGNNHEKAH